MIYINDNSQDKITKGSDCVIEIKGDSRVVTFELTMVLYQLHYTNLL